MISVTAPLEIWSNDEGRVHFLTVPADVAIEIRAHGLSSPRGFGSVRVQCTIGEVSWRTSVFPQKSGGYFLPVKKDVCERAGIAAGDEVSLKLELL